ncbi:MAG TPA: hypothetical protein VMZ28_28380 [Kofleriaceae bacterium]|nr:hypothetical protein [Kofleriaceae bacterium]
MRSWLISLPHDLKILYEAAADANLDRASRELAIGAIIYVISPNDFVASDRQDFSGYADDCLVLRLALRRIGQNKDEDVQTFVGRFDDFFGSLTDELGVCEKAMGELYGWLDARVDTLTAIEYKGKKVPLYLDDEELSELLYEDGLAFATEYPVDEDDIADRFKKASTIIEVIQRRKAEEDRKRAG